MVFFMINELTLANDINNGVYFISNLPNPITQFRFSIVKSGGTKTEVLTVTTGGSIYMPFAYSEKLAAGTYYPLSTVSYVTQ